MELTFEDKPLVGVERLYRRTILIEPSTVCAAHCRWCLRGQYPTGAMQRDDIALAARYIGAPEQRDDIDEVLITGGDPLMVVPLLRYTFEQLAEHAPNVRVVRIGTRVPASQRSTNCIKSACECTISTRCSRTSMTMQKR
jgi:lysine 2,3-aminomutase